MKDRKNASITDEVLCAEYKAVYYYVLSLCRNESTAQDITQETFLKAIKASGSFSGASSLYTWLCSIAKNLWLNRCKQQSKEAPIDEAVFAESSFEQRIFDIDLSLHIHRALHELHEPYKEVFSLRIFGELSFADIAGLFSKTESWARVTYHRAKSNIIEALRKDGTL